MSFAFPRLFKSKPREAKPKWGDFRIIRTETRGGDVQFLIQRFGWIGRVHFREYHEWNTHQPHHDHRLKFTHDTEASAIAEIARWRKAVADSEVISETVTHVPAPTTGSGE